MSNQNSNPRLLTDQIYNEFLQLLKEEKEFERDILEKIMALVKKGDLQKPQHVINALKESAGRQQWLAFDRALRSGCCSRWNRSLSALSSCKAFL